MRARACRARHVWWHGCLEILLIWQMAPTYNHILKEMQRNSSHLTFQCGWLCWGFQAEISLCVRVEKLLCEGSYMPLLCWPAHPKLWQKCEKLHAIWNLCMCINIHIYMYTVYIYMLLKKWKSTFFLFSFNNFASFPFSVLLNVFY